MAEENKKSVPAKSTTTAVKKVEGKLPFGQRVKKWFRDMKSELKKVIWPTPKQILNNTAVALFMMAVSAIVLWGFDELATMAVKSLINLVG
jgi:preprotein translocase subunit SecE